MGGVGPQGPSGPSGPTGTVLLTNPAPCTGSNWVKDIAADGTLTCTQVLLSNVGNPTGDVDWAWPTGAKLLFTFTGSTDNAFSIHGDGAFTGVGDLVHINKTGTGSAAGADALHVEVTSDTNMRGINIEMVNSTRTALTTNALISAAGFSGPLTGSVTGNAGTATALSTAGAANQFWKNGNVWGQPAFGDLSGSATTGQLPTITVAKGGSNLTTVAANQVYVGTAADTFTAKTLPSCSNATTSKLLFDNATQTFSCGTDQTGAGGSMPKVVTTNVTNSTTTPADITGLSWSVAANTEYGFHCVVTHQGTATGGPRFNLNGPASPTEVAVRYERATSATADTISTFTAFSAAAQTAAVTSGGTTTVLVSKIFGTIRNGANAGTAQFMLTSSTAGQTVTVYRGSFCVVY